MDEACAVLDLPPPLYDPENVTPGIIGYSLEKSLLNTLFLSRDFLIGVK